MKNIFLTGASRGIGLETAKLLSQKGFEVWGTARELSRLPELPGFHPIRLDLNKPKTIETGFVDALKDAGHFDVLINNAGNGYFGPTEYLSHEIWQEQFQTLVFGPLQLIHLMFPEMKKRNAGLVINITSLAARFPIPFMSSYNSAKAAFSALTQSLRLEIGHHENIHVVELQPGDIRTPFHEAMRHSVSPDDPFYLPVINNAAETIKANMNSAPPPEVVAREILRIIDNPEIGTVCKAGGFFQTIMAPLGARLAPPIIRERALRSFYQLDKKS